MFGHKKFVNVSLVMGPYSVRKGGFMAVEIASWLVTAVGIYVAIGLVFLPFFVIRGVGAIDAVAVRGTGLFRLVIVPGVVVFWPYLAKRWFGGATEPPEEKNPHRVAARGGVK
jgi:hypothetical protein